MNTILNNATTWGAEANKLNANFANIAANANRFLADGNLYNHDVFGSEVLIEDSGSGYLANIYALYDALVTAYPDYVTRTLIATEYTDLPIYRYDFTPSNPTGATITYNLPAILYLSGTHAERNAAAAGIKLLQNICNNWQQSTLLSVLKWGVKFSVIPAVNPYAFNTTGRINSRGVDINRNYPVGWALSGEGTIYYSGPSALSEIETQAVYNILTTEDFIFAIDHHNSNVFSDAERIFFTLSNSKHNGIAIYREMISRYLNQHLKKEFPANIDQTNFNHVQSTQYTDSQMLGMTVGAFQNAGILLEFVYSWGDDNGLTAAQLQDFQTYSLGVMMYAALQKFEAV